MTARDNFLNAKPSISTDNEPARAEVRSTTDRQLEETEHSPLKRDKPAKGYEKRVNDAQEAETTDNGMDEEA